MNSVYYVYIYIIDGTEEVFYVGKGKDDRAYKGKRNKFCEDMKKTHKWSVLIVEDELTEDQAFVLESELIAKYKNKGHRITNQTEGGDGISGYIMTNEIKEKISETSKMKWKEDNEFVEKQMWHRQYGVYKSEEFRRKISMIVKGQNNPNYGNKWSYEKRNELSRKRIENGKSKGTNNSRATKIMCIETGKIYDYIKLASEEYGLKNQASITVALKNPNRTAGGVHWVKVEN